jgi:hypothetical protein
MVLPTTLANCPGDELGPERGFLTVLNYRLDLRLSISYEILYISAFGIFPLFVDLPAIFSCSAGAEQVYKSVPGDVTLRGAAIPPPFRYTLIYESSACSSARSLSASCSAKRK